MMLNNWRAEFVACLFLQIFHTNTYDFIKCRLDSETASFVINDKQMLYKVSIIGKTCKPDLT